MYDNLPFKTQHLPTIHAILENDLLDFKGTYSVPFPSTHRRADEVKYTYTLNKYYNITLKVKYDDVGKPVELTSTGSFHYLRNMGKHNADYVSLWEAQQFLEEIKNKFGIQLHHLKLKPFEFAQMIEIPFDIEDLIRNLFCEERKMFINNSAGNPSKISGKPSNDYRLKCYSKYHEHPSHCKPNTLRSEFQAKKTRVLRLGKPTMLDLLKRSTWVTLFSVHMERIKQVVIFDSSIVLPVNSKYKKELNEMSNPNYWEKLISDCKNGEFYRTKYNEKVTTLRMLSKKYGSNVHEVIMGLIEKQWIRFLGVCETSSYEVTKKPTLAPFLKPTLAPFIECKPCTHFINALSKICPVTGLDISMQKPDSNLLSNTGLKYYEKTEPKIFLTLEQILLTGKPNKFEKTKYDKIAKQIRNRFNNGPDNFNPCQSKLF